MNSRNGNAKVAKVASTAAKWATPYGLLQANLQRFRVISVGTEEDLEALDRTQLLGIYYSVSASLFTSLILGIIGCAALYYGSIAYDAFSPAVALGTICVLISIYKVNRLRIDFRTVKVALEKTAEGSKEDKEKSLEEIFDPTKEFYLFKAVTHRYLYSVAVLFCLTTFIRTDSIQLLLEKGFTFQSTTLLVVVLGSVYLGLRAYLAHRDTQTLRRLDVSYTVKGFYNISKNMSSVVRHFAVALVAVLICDALSEKLQDKSIDLALKVGGQLALWGYSIVIAVGIAKTFTYFCDFISMEQSAKSNEVLGLFGIGSKLPTPPDYYSKASVAIPRLLGIAITLVALVGAQDWSNIVGYAALLLFSALLFSIADMREELNRGG